MKKTTSMFFVLVFIMPVLVLAQPEPYSMLDSKPYDPETHPNIDMFISSWKESAPRALHGSLVERAIFTRCEEDPLHPATRGAVLTEIKRLSHAMLEAHTSTTPSTLTGEQEIFYIDSGKGIIKTGNKTADLREGVCVLMPLGIEFTITNTGDESLGMYIIVEPVPEGFQPKKEMVVKDENLLPLGGTTGHWCHITKAVFNKEDGLATLSGLCPVWFDPMTMGQPHSHGPGVEEIWFALKGDITILLGKQLRKLPPGTAYKIPPDGNTPHSTINVTDKPIKVFWLMKNVQHEILPYSQLDSEPYNPEVDAHIDMYTSNWKESMPQKTHGALVERDILTKGDPMNPPVRGAVLEYAHRFTHASLGAYESTSPTTLENEQEIFYILSGKGSITAGSKTAELYPGIAVLMPAKLEFTMKNTGAETVTMYLISEPYPEGFRLNKEMLIADENKRAWNKGNPHWVGLSKPLFNTQSGLGTITNIITVQFDPMTFFHPHSHQEGIEEVWTAVCGDIHVLLGKQIRHQPPGMGYMIPPDGKTPHANFNVSNDRIKLFYFARFPGSEPRK